MYAALAVAVLGLATIKAQLAPEPLLPAAPALAPLDLSAAAVDSGAASTAPTYPAAPGYAPGPIAGVPDAASAPGFALTVASAEASGVDTSASACYNSNCGETCTQAQTRISSTSGTTLPILLMVGNGSNANCTDSSQRTYTCCEQTCTTNTDCSSNDYCGSAPGSTSNTSNYCFSCNCTSGTPNPGVSNNRCKQECAVSYATSIVGNTTNSTSCFPGYAQVSTPMGSERMTNLRIGDKVLTLTPDGQAVFEEIFMFSHREQNQAAIFTTLSTASGHSITATHGHYVWAAKAGQPAGIVRMQDVQMGDLLLTSALSKGDRELRSAVVRISTGLAEGLYNPHTPSGSIIVNGVAATAFTDVLPPSTAVHAVVTLPMRLMFALLPSRSMAQAVNDALLHFYFRPVSGPAVLRSLLNVPGKI